MRQDSGDILIAKVAMAGGGSCKWTLSAVNFGIEYIDAILLGKDLVPSTVGGVLSPLIIMLLAMDNLPLSLRM